LHTLILWCPKHKSIYMKLNSFLKKLNFIFLSITCIFNKDFAEAQHDLGVSFEQCKIIFNFFDNYDY